MVTMINVTQLATIGRRIVRSIFTIITASWGMRNFFIVWCIPNFIIIPGFGIKEGGDWNVVFYEV